ncbi:MAG: universal stress protein, partial [Bacteroidota bacterium]
MQTILTTTDFTPSSLNACHYAAMLAGKLKCKLTILNLFDIPLVHSNSGLFFMSFQSTKKDHGEQLKKLEADLHKHHPKLEIDSVITTGSLKNEVQNFIDSHRIKAVVMGLGTKTKLNRYLYGSHSTDLAGKILAPVIIVPEKYTNHQLHSILVGVDNNQKLYHAKLEHFEIFVKECKAKLRLLHVRTEEEIFKPVQLELILNHKTQKIVSRDAKTVQLGIVEYANDFSFDMIVVISKKHSAFYEMFSETNTKQIAFASNIPVMAIHD